MELNGRFNHIEDVLARLHLNQWFEWVKEVKDVDGTSFDPKQYVPSSKNKVYENLRLTKKIGVGGELIDNPIKGLPTEKELTDALAKQQSDFDAQEYARNRASAYDSIGNQLDQLMKDMRDGTTTHQTACEAVKAKFPKPE